MSLIDLWNSARDSIEDKHVQQIISFSGSGKFADGNETSQEFRKFLSYIPSDLLIKYANECLTTKFEQNGFALQDIVNQIGQRLSFTVSDGLYRGKKNEIGFDGIWKLSDNGDIVLEVKTTDAYRIDLNVLASYRFSLIKKGKISEKNSSILIVVGRQDTGDLEAQIRGSRHAWDIRLISVDSLIRLMKLKETVEDPSIVTKICNILTPQEFTRVDSIIDIVFSTAEDINIGSDIEKEDEEGNNESTSTEKAQPVAFHNQCISRLSKKLNVSLTKQSRSTYKSPNNDIALSCAVSKKHVRQNKPFYWFAFHPSQKEYLQKAALSYAAFGCGSEDVIFLFPLEKLLGWLPNLNQTSNSQRHYWHIQITNINERWFLLLKSGHKDIDITEYLV